MTAFPRSIEPNPAADALLRLASGFAGILERAAPAFELRGAARLTFVLWFVAAGCVGSPTPCAAGNAVALHGDSELRAATVRLSDLFSGVSPLIDRDIAQAPPPGKSATYGAPVLEKLADKYLLNWRAESANDHVTLTTAATRITADDLRAAILRQIRDSGVHGDIEANLDNHALEIDLPASQSPDITLSNFDYDPVSKRFRCDVGAGSGNAALSVPVSGRAVVKRRVPVLAHRMESGSVIALTDIDWVTVPDERVTVNAVTSADQLIGRELRHTVADGDVLNANDVMPARLVLRGSLVTLKVTTPYMQLTAQGKALQDGAEGDVVRVNNTRSNRMLEGTVTGPGEVTIRAAGQKLALAQ
jgi:flagella basal body P-ring formation protein FlgA